MFLLFAGVVSASSINGDYKGNPIVKITSNGKALELDEVPPMIYDGHTVVPISLLRQLGASVTWDPTTYGVDVKLPSQSPVQDLTGDIKKINEAIKTLNGTSAQLIYDAIGPYLKIYIESTDVVSNDLANMTVASGYAAFLPVDEIIVFYMNKGTTIGSYKIQKKDAVNYANNAISVSDYQKTFVWNAANNNVPITPITPVTPTAPIQNQQSQQPAAASNESPKPADNSQTIAVCNSISNQYESKRRTTREELANQGLSSSGDYDSAMKQIDDDEKSALSSAGCMK